MAGLIKLTENEKQILRLEEETLRKLISQYQSALNALKVEELTLTNCLGKTLDRVRKSRANTPLTYNKNPNRSGLITLPVLSSQINTSEDVFKPFVVQDTIVNQSTLNLDASPSINKMIAAYEEDEEL